MQGGEERSARQASNAEQWIRVYCCRKMGWFPSLSLATCAPSPREGALSSPAISHIHQPPMTRRP